MLQKPYNIATLRKSLQEAGAVPVSASSLAPSAEPQQEPMGRRAKVLSASDEGGR